MLYFVVHFVLEVMNWSGVISLSACAIKYLGLSHESLQNKRWLALAAINFLPADPLKLGCTVTLFCRAAHHCTSLSPQMWVVSVASSLPLLEDCNPLVHLPVGTGELPQVGKNRVC